MDDPFKPFWAFLGQTLGRDRLTQVLINLSPSLEEAIDNPFTDGYTSRYLAYQVLIASTKEIYGIDISAMAHPKVDNEPLKGEPPVYVFGLMNSIRCLTNGMPLLLDILDGGIASKDHEELAIKYDLDLDLTSLKLGPQPDPASTPWGTEFVLFIPDVVNIEKNVAPHILEFQQFSNLELAVDVEHRVITSQAKLPRGRSRLYDLMVDREREEFRCVFLAYVWQCLNARRSFDFMVFLNVRLKGDRKFWTRMSEGWIEKVEEKFEEVQADDDVDM